MKRKTFWKIYSELFARRMDKFLTFQEEHRFLRWFIQVIIALGFLALLFWR